MKRLGLALLFLSWGNLEAEARSYEISNIVLQPLTTDPSAFPNYLLGSLLEYKLTPAQATEFNAAPSYTLSTFNRIKNMTAPELAALDPALTAPAGIVTLIRSKNYADYSYYLEDAYQFALGMLDPSDTFDIILGAGNYFEFFHDNASGLTFNDDEARYILAQALISYAGDASPLVFSYNDSVVDPANDVVNFTFQFSCPSSSDLVIKHPTFELDDNTDLPVTVISQPTHVNASTCSAVFQINLSGLAIGTHALVGTLRFELWDPAGNIYQFAGRFSLGVVIGNGGVVVGNSGDSTSPIIPSSSSVGSSGAQSCSLTATSARGVWSLCLFFFLVSLLGLRKKKVR